MLATEAEAAGLSFLEHWALTIGASDNLFATLPCHGWDLRLVQSRISWKPVMNDALDWLIETAAAGDGVVSDASEDKAAWETAYRAIRSEKGGDIDLAELLQGIS